MFLFLSCLIYYLLYVRYPITVSVFSGVFHFENSWDDNSHKQKAFYVGDEVGLFNHLINFLNYTFIILSELSHFIKWSLISVIGEERVPHKAEGCKTKYRREKKMKPVLLTGKLFN